VRFLPVTLACLLGAGWARAAPAPAAADQYEQQKKSVPLAVTLEAISPVAGMGAVYAGDTDHGTVLAVASGAALVIGAGGAFWLAHLVGENPTGNGRTWLDVQEVSAVGLLVGAGLTYLLTRVSGLALAPQVTRAFNEGLRVRLSLPPLEPTIPFHAWAPVPSLRLAF
jgi:hypothetical protein